MEQTNDPPRVETPAGRSALLARPDAGDSQPPGAAEIAAMIIRLIAVDPKPREGKSDVLVYQVPENSREEAVLKDMLTQAGMEWTMLASPRRKRA